MCIGGASLVVVLGGCAQEMQIITAAQPNRNLICDMDTNICNKKGR